MFRFAIIGCGRIARRHAENVNRVGKLVAVCDINMGKAQELAERYGAKPYTSLAELLQAEREIEIVVICTPNGYHAEHCIQSLDSGRNVLCEKPLCINTRDAQQIIEAEKRNGKKLFVVKSMRFNPLLQDLKRLMTSNELGKIYSFQLSCFWNRPKEYYQDWHGKSNIDGGTLYTQFSHYIDAILWLFGDLKSASGFTSNAALGNVIEFEDTGVASLLFENGILGTLNWSVNTFQRNYEIALAVLAEKGTIVIGGEYLNELKYLSIGFDIHFKSLSGSECKQTLSHHAEVYNNLIWSLQHKKSTITSAYDGLKTIEAVENIYSSVNKIDFLLS